MSGKAVQGLALLVVFSPLLRTNRNRRSAGIGAMSSAVKLLQCDTMNPMAYWHAEQCERA